MQSASDSIEHRVLILAPTAKDASMSCSILDGAGIDCAVVDSLDEMCSAAENGAAALLVTEDTLSTHGLRRLKEMLQRQPAWSDLPVLVLTHGGIDSAGGAVALETLGNTTLLDRPVRVTMLVSAIRTAIRARQRQYQIREYLAEQEQSRQALRDADRRKDEFLAMLAHELRNPLASVTSAAAVLRKGDVPAPVLRRSQEVIHRQSQQMARLLDDLLDVSRITQGRIDLRLQVVNLAAVAEEVSSNCRPIIDARAHQFSVLLPPEPIYVNADRARLEQILSNLLSNAAKYTANGGRIDLSVTAEGTDALIRVRDTGFGIAPELLPHIFDLFTQAERTLARSEGGVGIGLTMVKRLVEMHSGTVTVHSGGHGKGSEFVVTLPLVKADIPLTASVLQDSHTSCASTFEPRRVLIVEDNPDAAEMMAAIIEMWGHQVLSASTGEESLLLAQEFQPDIVLLDIGLPGMDGYETAARFRADAAFETVNLVALTGYGQESDRRRSREAGFQHHLTKPVDPDRLFELIQSVCPLNQNIAPAIE